MKQIYITFREQKEVRRTADDKDLERDDKGHVIFDELTPLGYAAEYRKGDVKTEKKNKDQLYWADSSYEIREGIMYVTERVWTPYVEGRVSSFVDVEAPAKYQPMIVDNDALEGFKISKTVSRSTTANKLWRILDPRGFELEISTANMEDILMNGTVIVGEIIGQYQWDFGKNGIGKAHLIKAKP